MIRLGVLGSTKGSDLQAVLDAIHNDALDAAVVVVISNRENSYILVRIIVGLFVSKGFYRVKLCSFPRRIKTEENSYCRGKPESEKNAKRLNNCRRFTNHCDHIRPAKTKYDPYDLSLIHI